MFTFLKNHSLIAFYILAFVLAWCIKIPVTLYAPHNIALQFLPSIIPALAALLMAAIIAGRQGIGELLRQAGKWRVSPIWYLIALIAPGALALLALVLATPFGEAFPRFVFPGIRIFPEILVGTLIGFGEELGWRGFALPRLQARFNPLLASLIVGFLWWAWHLPEALAGSAEGVSFQQGVGLECRDLIKFVAASILITWIYNNTDANVLLAALFHMSIGGLLAQFLALPQTTTVTPDGLLLDLLLCITAAIVVLLNRKLFLTHNQPGNTQGVRGIFQPSASSSSSIVES